MVWKAARDEQGVNLLSSLVVLADAVSLRMQQSCPPSYERKGYTFFRYIVKGGITHFVRRLLDFSNDNVVGLSISMRL
jgi:hypothetical protein